jgi:hypothetical protein
MWYKGVFLWQGALSKAVNATSRFVPSYIIVDMPVDG